MIGLQRPTVFGEPAEVVLPPQKSNTNTNQVKNVISCGASNETLNATETLLRLLLPLNDQVRVGSAISVSRRVQRTRLPQPH